MNVAPVWKSFIKGRLTEAQVQFYLGHELGWSEQSVRRRFRLFCERATTPRAWRGSRRSEFHRLILG